MVRNLITNQKRERMFARPGTSVNDGFIAVSFLKKVKPQALLYSNVNKLDGKLFMFLISHLVQQDNIKLKFTVDQINTVLEKFLETKEQQKSLIMDTNQHLLDTSVALYFGWNEVHQVNIFVQFNVDFNKNTYEVQFNEYFFNYLKQIREYANQINFDNLILFKSKYSMKLYRQIFAHRQEKTLKMSIHDFMDLMGLNNESQRNIKFINDRILPMIRKELPFAFLNFKVHKLKENASKSSKVEYLVFDWQL